MPLSGANLSFSKLDDYNYIFDGKTNLKDFYKVLQIEDTIFEEILIFIGKVFSWLFILAAYFGAFIASVILMRENEDLNDTKYSILFFGTLGWILPLVINSIHLLPLVTQSFWLNVIIFAASGFMVYAVLNIFKKED